MNELELVFHRKLYEAFGLAKKLNYTPLFLLQDKFGETTCLCYEEKAKICVNMAETFLEAEKGDK